MDSTIAILPVKPLAEAKTRLAGVLNTAERVALARRLLERTLLKLSRARGVTRVVVISRDEAVLKIARKYGAWSVGEVQTDNVPAGLNPALEQARRLAIANGARSLLIIPADLPRLRVRDIEKIIALAQPAPHIVIVPAARDGGTNALLLNPANAIPFQFGESSFSKHTAAATAQSIPFSVYTANTVTLDLDTPEDLTESQMVNRE